MLNDGINLTTTKDAKINSLTVGKGASTVAGGIPSNTAVGKDALSSNTTGSNNIAIGMQALLKNNTGVKNVAIGTDALGVNTTGSDNTAIGHNADVQGVNRQNATAIGSGAVVTADNTIQLGNAAVLKVVTDGAIEAGGAITAGVVTYPNIDGTTNQVLTTNGAGALSWTNVQAATVGTASQTLRHNGIQWVAASNVLNDGINLTTTKDAKINSLTVGKGASTVAGGIPSNTAVGKDALSSNTTGSNNIAIGMQALLKNNTGVKNVAIGTDALGVNTTGSDNTAIGHNADVQGVNRQNATAIGSGAVVTADNTIQLGNAAVLKVVTDGAIEAGGAITAGVVTYPNIDGTTNQVLTTNGAGALAWTSVGSVPVGSASQTLRYDAGAWVVANSLKNDGTTVTTTADMKINGLTVGKGAITAAGGNDFNTAVGVDALLSNTTGQFNTALGWQTLALNGTGEKNTASGYGALNKNSSGNSNTASGYQALNSNETGSSNTGIGNRSLYTNTLGKYNTATGYESLFKNETGDSNTTSGAFALYENTAGKYNTATGLEALRLTTGSNNTAIGFQALYSNTTGSNNTAIGYLADVSGASLNNATAIGNGAKVNADNTIQLGNTAVVKVVTSGAITVGAVTYPNTAGTTNQVLAINGAGALAWTSVGSLPVGSASQTLRYDAGAWVVANSLKNDGTTVTTTADMKINGLTVGKGNNNLAGNTAFGEGALSKATAPNGFQNTAIGFKSLGENVDGNRNTATGYESLVKNISGKNNSAFGFKALSSNVGGDKNTVSGSYALTSNSSGNSNTASGTNALYWNKTGTENTAIGDNAGYGSNGKETNQSTFIGHGSFVVSNRTNITMLGADIVDAQCTADNQIMLGNTAITHIRAQVSSITAYSDRRFKTNIQENVSGLDFIMKLKPVTYNVRPTELHKIWGTPDSLYNNIDFSAAENMTNIGFIAQDVEMAAKESGFNFPGIDVPKNDKEVYLLRYGDFIMPIVKAMQEQQELIIKLQERISILEKK